MTPEDMAAAHAAAFPDSRAWSAREFADLLGMPGVFAEGDHRCFALVRVIADEAELLTIATRPDARRQGLARGVMTTWHDAAMHRGASTAFLEVAADNRAAIALYAGCAYAEIGRRRGYYARSGGKKVDALLMKRSFGPPAPA